MLDSVVEFRPTSYFSYSISVFTADAKSTPRVGIGQKLTELMQQLCSSASGCDRVISISFV